MHRRAFRGTPPQVITGFASCQEGIHTTSQKSVFSHESRASLGERSVPHAQTVRQWRPSLNHENRFRRYYPEQKRLALSWREALFSERQRRVCHNHTGMSTVFTANFRISPHYRRKVPSSSLFCQLPRLAQALVSPHVIPYWPATAFPGAQASPASAAFGRPPPPTRSAPGQRRPASGSHRCRERRATGRCRA